MSSSSWGNAAWARLDAGAAERPPILRGAYLERLDLGLKGAGGS
ncbi:MAG: hypothetical protein RXR01_08010 [Thermoproteus sp.]